LASAGLIDKQPNGVIPFVGVSEYARQLGAITATGIDR